MMDFGDAAWASMSPAMWMARFEAAQVHRTIFAREMVITSGRRPATPGGSSRHETGNAMDIRVREPDRTWAMSGQQQVEFARILTIRLGPDYDVIVEGPAATIPRYRDRVPHIHVEYDPKGRHLTEQVED